jgi:hypothetical protein
MICTKSLLPHVFRGITAAASLKDGDGRIDGDVDAGLPRYHCCGFIEACYTREPGCSNRGVLRGIAAAALLKLDLQEPDAGGE